MRRPLHERVEEKTDRSAGPTACHPWRGNVNPFGTPTVGISIGGRNGRKTGGSARRMWWEHCYGPVPADRMVKMTCGNRQCINERHMTIVPRKDPVARFWSKVQKTDGCWIWTGYRNARGYGQFMGTWKTVTTAHRYSFELANGPIPEDAPPCICHRCDQPACVRPDHLFLGTYLENHQDMVAKGRQSKGEKHAKACADGRAAARAKRSGEHKSVSGTRSTSPLPPVPDDKA